MTGSPNSYIIRARQLLSELLTRYELSNSNTILSEEVGAFLDEPVPSGPNGGWIGVKDQLPDASGGCMTWFQEQHSILHFDKQHGWYWGDGENKMHDAFSKEITHWMPLPEGPSTATRSE